MSCNNCYNGCVETTSDKCVKYTGINIPELGITKGDPLSFVLLQITNAIIALDVTTTTSTTLSPTTTTTTTLQEGLVWSYNITLYSCEDCSFVNATTIINSEPLTLLKWYSYENVKFIVNSFISSYIGTPLYNVLDSSKQDTCNEVVCPPTTTTTTTSAPVTTTTTTSTIPTTTTTTTAEPTTTTTTTISPTTTTTTTAIAPLAPGIIPPIETLLSFGALYNWWAATDSRNIAPIGFHLPSKEELDIMVEYSGGYLDKTTVYKLKEVNSNYWESPQFNNNELLFNSVGSGQRDIWFNFLHLKRVSFLWTSTENVDYTPNAYVLAISDNITMGPSNKAYGYAIRFIADSGTPITATGNDGKIYSCVTIGTQTWTASNSNETKYRNGDWIHGYDNGIYTPISNINWKELTTEAMCYYDNDENNG